MRHSELTKLINRNAVLLAVYALTDDAGFVCSATNAQIGAVLG